MFHASRRGPRSGPLPVCRIAAAESRADAAECLATESPVRSGCGRPQLRTPPCPRGRPSCYGPASRARSSHWLPRRRAHRSPLEELTDEHQRFRLANLAASAVRNGDAETGRVRHRGANRNVFPLDSLSCRFAIVPAPRLRATSPEPEWGGLAGPGNGLNPPLWPQPEGRAESSLGHCARYPSNEGHHVVGASSPPPELLASCQPSYSRPEKHEGRTRGISLHSPSLQRGRAAAGWRCRGAFRERAARAGSSRPAQRGLRSGAPDFGVERSFAGS